MIEAPPIPYVPRSEEFVDLAWSVAWDEEADLKTMVFYDGSATWIFHHIYRKSEQWDLKLYNDLNLVVGYLRGEVASANLSMNIIIPERLGKRVIYGCDLSPGAKTFLQFEYALQESRLRLTEIRRGAATVIPLDDREGLVKQVEFPFPIPDVIENEHGTFKVSYRRNDDEFGQFHFPARIRMNR